MHVPSFGSAASDHDDGKPMSLEPAILVSRLLRQVDAIGGRNPRERGRAARRWAEGPQVFPGSARNARDCMRNTDRAAMAMSCMFRRLHTRRTPK